MKQIVLGTFLATIAVAFVSLVYCNQPLFNNTLNNTKIRVAGASPQIEIPIPDPNSPKCPSLGNG